MMWQRGFVAAVVAFAVASATAVVAVAAEVAEYSSSESRILRNMRAA